MQISTIRKPSTPKGKSVAIATTKYRNVKRKGATDKPRIYSGFFHYLSFCPVSCHYVKNNSLKINMTKSQWLICHRVGFRIIALSIAQGARI